MKKYNASLVDCMLWEKTLFCYLLGFVIFQWNNQQKQNIVLRKFHQLPLSKRISYFRKYPHPPYGTFYRLDFPSHWNLQFKVSKLYYLKISISQSTNQISKIRGNISTQLLQSLANKINNLIKNNNIWRGVWKKALSDSWSHVKFSCSVHTLLQGSEKEFATRILPSIRCHLGSFSMPPFI